MVNVMTNKPKRKPVTKKPTLQQAIDAGHKKQPLMDVIREKCRYCKRYEAERDTAKALYKAIEECDEKQCPLWAYRYGHNPFGARDWSQEDRKKAGERLVSARENKGKKDDV